MQISTYQNNSAAAQKAAQHRSRQGSAADDDDAWSGYGDTLELESHDYGPENSTQVDNDAFASPNPAPIESPQVANEFAAAEARLNERGRILEERQRMQARRPNLVNLQHLNGGYGASSYMGPGGYAGSGYPGSGYPGSGYAGSGYRPSPYGRHVGGYRPHASAVPAVMDASHAADGYNLAGTTAAGYPPPVDPTTGQPYPLDSWGNPILPPGAELDAYGNIIYP